MNPEKSLFPDGEPEGFRLGLVGYPLGHSLSPRLQQAALSAGGLRGDYRLYPVDPLPDGAPELAWLLENVRTGGLHGLNVTIPHKQSVLQYMDELAPAADAIGAVNTIFTSQARLVGDNTDARGFYSDLYRQLDIPAEVRRALVLGAGGSARAVVFALLEDGWQVTVAARRLFQAVDLVKGFQTRAVPTGSPARSQPQAIELSPIPLKEYISRFSALDSPNLLIVNTTPAGMAPYADGCAWPLELPFPGGAFIYDLVYNPPDTRLTQMARSQGIPAASGLGMLVEQAALAFEIWTGKRASREAMHAAVSDLSKHA